MLILVMESSTSSAKAMLYDSQAGITDMHSEPYDVRAAQAGEIGAQDPEAIFLHTAAVARKLAEGKKIDAVVPCGTWHNVLAADRDMVPVTPAYTWTYNGAAEVAGRCRADESFRDGFYQRTGCMVHAIYPVFKLRTLQERGVDLRDRFICSQGSYNVYRLTGERVTTDSTASGSGLLGVHTRKWDPECLRLAGIREDQVFRLSDYHETFPLSAEGARLLGQPTGVPVLPNYPDGALNQVGAGALPPGVMTFSVGTSGALRLSVEKPVLPETPSTWCYLSPNAWLSGAATSGACNCLDWCKRMLFPPEVSYADLEACKVDVAGMPLFLPFLFGERCPGWNDEWRGGFVRVQPHHGPADLYRSVQEGVLFNLYHCYQILCGINGTPNEVQLSGGITNSRVWMQMCCDIFGRPLTVADIPHASMLGGAVLAMETLGFLSRIEDYRADATEKLTPDGAMHELYERRFEAYLERYEKNIC